MLFRNSIIRAFMLAVFTSTAVLSGQQTSIEGLPESKVRVIIYEDLQCPDCAAFRRMLDDKILPRYADKIAFVHRDFPLAKHAWARKAAIASRYFAELKPELGLEYRRHIMSTIKETTPENFNDKLVEFARKNAVDPAAALAALNDSRLAGLVERDFQDGVARGVAKTPTVFVSGKPFIETFSFEELRRALDDALAGN
jgi:protein-disulfide isomerase